MKLFAKGRLKDILFVVAVATIYLALRIFLFNESSAYKRKPFRPLSEKRVKTNTDWQNSQKVKDHDADVAKINDRQNSQKANNDDVYVPIKQEIVIDTDIKTCDKSLLGMPRPAEQQAMADYTDVTCDALLHGDGTQPVYELSKQFMTNHPFQKVKDEEFINMAQDCQRFKRERGYHTLAVSENEASFPIAYNILVHKDVQQIEHLLRAIYRPQNAYCMHVDAKQPESFHNALRAIAACFDNVYIASKLEHVIYAGYSRLQADINCMLDQVQHPIAWRYLINIAGQSFPLKTNEEIINILRIYNGANDIEGIYGKRILRSRFDNEWNETAKGGPVKTGKKNPPPPHDIEIVRGSAYGIFSRKFVEFIVSDERSKALLEWSRNTYSPDEHFWATLHHTYGNPHLKTPGAFSGKPDSKLWMAVWVAWGGVDKCHGMWRRGTCVFGVADLPQLLPHHEIFANKFYIEYEYLGLYCLNKWIEYKVTCPGPDSEYDFYRQLPYIYKPKR